MLKINLKCLFLSVLFVCIANAQQYLPADHNTDGTVNNTDFGIISENWLAAYTLPDLTDLAEFWLAQAEISPNVTIDNFYTDKSRYLPDSYCTFTIICSNNSTKSYSGSIIIRISKHGKLSLQKSLPVTLTPDQSKTIRTFWQLPPDDFQGYLAEAWLDNGSLSVTAIDVSSDWKRYPRYGYITEFYQGQTSAHNSEIMNLLSREYHINCLQYYDWMWRHENVIQRNGEAIVDPWTDWRGANISFAVIQDSIAKASNLNIAPMPYFQIYMALDNYQQISGVSEQWGLYSDTNHSNQYYHDAGINMWLFNPGNVNWQNHLCSQYTDALTTMNWAGLHLDQLGNIGGDNYKNYWGDTINLPNAFESILNRSKDHLDYLEATIPSTIGRDALIFNIVDGGVGHWAVDQTLASKVDIIYSELWSTENYISTYDFVRYAKANTNNKPVILAAYMNKGEDAGGFFNTPSVLLADAAFAASGAHHLELGDGSHMLSQEFFPARDKIMSDNLKTTLKDYYNFITAYESLLFTPELRYGDGGLQWLNTAGYNLSGNASPDTIWFINRANQKYEIFHLINLLNNDDQWRNTAIEPDKITNIPVKLRISPDISISNLFLASPDINHGIMQKLPYTIQSDSNGIYISTTLPSLKYWDMICIERNLNQPLHSRYEAENAILNNTSINTDHTGYTGAGFVDHFAETYDSVSFYINIPQNGNYSLSFRYANSWIEADRMVLLNGDYAGTITMPTLPNWDSWSNSDLNLNLNAGIHQVILYYSESNTGAINLDSLQVISMP